MKHKEQSRQVSANLRALVEHHGITQQQLADAVRNENTGRNVTRQAVTALLNGKFSPSLDVLFQYLNAVNGLAGTNYTLRDIDIKEAAYKMQGTEQLAYIQDGGIYLK